MYLPLNARVSGYLDLKLTKLSIFPSVLRIFMQKGTNCTDGENPSMFFRFLSDQSTLTCPDLPSEYFTLNW